MSRFERDKQDPLEYKIGDKIMGYHFGNGGMFLIAGEVVSVDQPLSIFSRNSYEVRLIKELLNDGVEEGVTLHLKEDEARPFVEERIKEAIIHWKNEMMHRAEAGKEYIKMLKALYPENYQKNDIEKDGNVLKEKEKEK